MLWDHRVQKIGMHPIPATFNKGSCTQATDMDRITCMKQNKISSREIFKEIGTVRWTNNHSFEVRTKFTARLFLSPNTDPDTGPPTQVIVDEVFVPKRFRRRGNATKAMTALCRLADKYQFSLEGGPVGGNIGEWSKKFAEWVLSFGFVRNRSTDVTTDDPAAFYVVRRPRK